MLFQNVKQIKPFLGGVQANLSDGTFIPFVAGAEFKYLIPAIGIEFYQYLDPKVQTDVGIESLSADETLALIYLQRALAYYSLLDAMPFLNIQIGNVGIQEQSTANNVPARQWAYFQAENAAVQNGDTFLDAALLFMESRSASFPTWKDSPAYTVATELFINSASELSRHISILNSRRAFLQIRSHLERAEQMHILPVLGSTKMAAIKAEMKGGNVSGETKPVLLLVQQALAHMALYESLPEIGISLSGNGIRILSDHDGIKGRLSATPEQVTALKENSLKLGSMYLSDLKAALAPATPPATPDGSAGSENENSPSFWA